MGWFKYTPVTKIKGRIYRRINVVASAIAYVTILPLVLLGMAIVRVVVSVSLGVLTAAADTADAVAYGYKCAVETVVRMWRM